MSLVADLSCDSRAHSLAFLLPIQKTHSASVQVSRLALADTRADPASLAACSDRPAHWDAWSVSAAVAPVGSLDRPVLQAERSVCPASAPVECLAFPGSVPVECLAFLVLVPEKAMASASQFLAVFLRPVDDTVAVFPVAVDANLPVVAAEAVAEGNMAVDSPAEILGSSRPTSTDSRNTASRRNKPSARPNSCASRNNPIRNSNC